MKRCLTVACLLMLVASSVAGAATKGSKELVFGFSGLNTLGLNTFNGGFGMRHYISDDMAVRPSVTLGFGSATTKATVGGNTDAKDTNNMFGLDVALEKHMGDSKTISPYLGVSIGFADSSLKQETSHAAAPATGTLLSTTTTGMGFGVSGLAGFQWFFTENISLGGEYKLGLLSTSHKVETVRQATTTTTPKTSGFSLGLSTATLSISVAL